MEGKQYDSIGRFTFSPDGKHLVYIASNKGDRGNPLTWYIVIDGIEKEYKSILQAKQVEAFPGQRINDPSLQYLTVVFDSPDTLHYMAMKGNDIYLVEEKLR